MAIFNGYVSLPEGKSSGRYDSSWFEDVEKPCGLDAEVPVVYTKFLWVPIFLMVKLQRLELEAPGRKGFQRRMHGVSLGGRFCPFSLPTTVGFMVDTLC